MNFTRTQKDVDDALKLRAEKVQTFHELTESEIEILEKGTLTYNTLNRIENKQAELKQLLNSIGYWSTSIINKAWNEKQIFNKDEFQRIVDNENILRDAFFVYSDTPKTPPVSYYYEDINSLEKILYDLEKMIENTKSFFRECDTFECGE